MLCLPYKGSVLNYTLLHCSPVFSDSYVLTKRKKKEPWTEKTLYVSHFDLVFGLKARSEWNWYCERIYFELLIGKFIVHWLGWWFRKNTNLLKQDIDFTAISKSFGFATKKLEAIPILRIFLRRCYFKKQLHFYMRENKNILVY